MAQKDGLGKRESKVRHDASTLLANLDLPGRILTKKNLTLSGYIQNFLLICSFIIREMSPSNKSLVTDNF